MENAVQDLRDLFASARLLRRLAREHDAHRELFLDAALALEERASVIADTKHLAEPERQHALDATHHAPVNILV
jgi:predicted kinase